MAAKVQALHESDEHAHVIGLIQAALIHGQSQPWMYEVLALSMEIEKHPREEIERVVLSLADFGTADFGTMSYSAAYLVRLGRDAAGLRLYQQASRMLPEQPEPYILGLRLARKLKDLEAVDWAATGVLQYAWTKDHQALHREAENAIAEAAELLRKQGQPERAEALQSSAHSARQRDLSVRLVWSGVGDLDLLVEEPSRHVCSFEQMETPGGGTLIHDGYGPEPENCYEEYVCALAQSGDYRIRVRHVWGEIVGNRATLTVIRHQGSPQEALTTKTIVLGPEESVTRVELSDGRRTSLRSVSSQQVSAALPSQLPPKRGRRPAGAPQEAAADYARSRGQLEGFEMRRTGAVGYQPVIQIVPDGTTFTAQAVVSPDRRYVRIGVSPMFTNLTDVFTFSFVNGGQGTGVNPGTGN
ncbi:MAG: hypothetical protein KDA75_08565 [Planctomycetaceae bacterium]|nr:hypothetical protein [Planctomycetaceae bacterium]